MPTRRQTPTGARRTRRLHLPQAVAARHDYLHDLAAAGGEADIALLRDKSTGDHVIFKSYRAGMAPDPVAMEILRQADPRHVVRLLEFHDGASGAWEIQEYCPHGSLRDWVAAQGGPLRTGPLTDVVRDIAGALTYLHGLDSGVAHRDLKPANVLVRTEEPLDLVLTDFGLAKAHQTITHLTTTVKGTWHYAAPEVHAKQSSAKSDWFSLGAIVYELYTGRQLFAMDDGTEVTEDDAKARSIAGNYSTDLIDDARWKLLADGLLTWDKDHRWGADQVQAWLAGESPSVASAPAGYRPAAARTVKYALPRIPTLVGTPAELAELFRAHWDDVSVLLAGRPDPKMIRFLEGFPEMAAAVRIVNSSEGPGSKLVQLQGILDPARSILFIGVPLEAEALQAQISAADAGDEQARDWLQALVEQRILLAYAEVTGSQQALDADHLLQAWQEQALATARLVCSTRAPVVLPLRDSVEAAEIARALTRTPEAFAKDTFQDVLPELVAQALRAPESRATSWLTRAAQAAAKRGATNDWAWSVELARFVQHSPDTDLGLLLVARVALDLTTQWAELRRRVESAEARRQAEAERARRAEERRQQEEERQRQEEEQRRQKEAEQRSREETEQWWARKVTHEEKRRRDAVLAEAKRKREDADRTIAELASKRDSEVASSLDLFEFKGLVGLPGVAYFLGGCLPILLIMVVLLIVLLLISLLGLPDNWGNEWIGPFVRTVFGVAWGAIGAWVVTTLVISVGRKVGWIEPHGRKIRQRYEREIAKVEAAHASNVNSAVIKIVHIPSDKIGSLIGPRGATIKQVQSTTRTTIELESWHAGRRTGFGSSYTGDRTQKWFDDGPYSAARGDGITVAVIQADDERGGESALRCIAEIVEVPAPAVGQQYEGAVVRLMPYGAFITLVPGVVGLLHISQLRDLNEGSRVERIEDVLVPGQRVRVEVSETRPDGKFSLRLAPSPQFAGN